LRKLFGNIRTNGKDFKAVFSGVSQQCLKQQACGALALQLGGNINVKGDQVAIGFHIVNETSCLSTFVVKHNEAVVGKVVPDIHEKAPPFFVFSGRFTCLNKIKYNKSCNENQTVFYAVKIYLNLIKRLDKLI